MCLVFAAKKMPAAAGGAGVDENEGLGDDVKVEDTEYGMPNQPDAADLSSSDSEMESEDDDDEEKNKEGMSKDDKVSRLAIGDNRRAVSWFP